MIMLICAVVALCAAILSFMDSRLPWLGIAVLALAIGHVLSALT